MHFRKANIGDCGTHIPLPIYVIYVLRAEDDFTLRLVVPTAVLCSFRWRANGGGDDNHLSCERTTHNKISLW